MMNSATISDCLTYRYTLERSWASFEEPRTVAFFGVNPSTADASAEDQTTMKWRRFASQAGFNRYLVGNAFAFRATDVNALRSADDPMGPENTAYLDQIIKEAEILVPCWGSRTKLPRNLHFALDNLMKRLKDSNKPIWVFGLSQSGDPLHPLMLPYSTCLVPLD